MSPNESGPIDGANYSADIVYTQHGVPHIRASDWGNLGFGQGWACAADHLGAMCDQALKAAGRRSEFLGIGPDGEHLRSDIGYRVLGLADRVDAFMAAQSTDARALLEGYAAGTRAWWAQASPEDVPDWCRRAAWVRGLDVSDVAMVMMDIVAFASGRNMAPMIGEAARPGEDPLGGLSHGRSAPITFDPGMGSNGWAFGAESTASGRGLVLANPHFPWWGEGRLWECHLTIPGDIDVYGVCLVGAPGVQIGTTERLAWTHTFSRGHRFTLYSHELHPDDPTQYRFDGQWQQMTCQEVVVPYRLGPGDVALGSEPSAMGDAAASAGGRAAGDENAGLAELRVKRYATRFGPVVSLPMVGWSEGFATSFRDANAANTGFVDQAIETARAQSVDDYVSTLASFGAMPWATSTIADADGGAAFLDYSVTPNLSPTGEAKFRRSVTDNPLTAMALELRVALLDGADPDFDWVDTGAAPWPGTVPPAQLPLLHSGKGVFNSNDPAWLCSMNERISSTPALTGIDRRPVSPRTRANGLIVARRWGSDLAYAGPDQIAPIDFAADDVPISAGWDVDSAVAALCMRRSLMADLLLDSVSERCSSAVHLGAAVGVLTGWDRTYNLDSVGAVLWREFLGSFTKEELSNSGRLWAEGFDPDRPFDTPHTLAAATDGDDPVISAMVAAVAALEAAGVPIDAPLGSVQWVERGDEKVPIAGGCEVEGIADVMGPFGAMARADIDPRGREGAPFAGRFERTGLSQGGYPCTYGVSAVMAMSFDERGPIGRVLLAYGQCSDERSAHYADQTWAWSNGELRPIVFHREDVEAGAVRTLTVSG